MQCGFLSKFFDQPLVWSGDAPGRTQSAPCPFSRWIRRNRCPQTSSHISSERKSLAIQWQGFTFFLLQCQSTKDNKTQRPQLGIITHWSHLFFVQHRTPNGRAVASCTLDGCLARLSAVQNPICAGRHQAVSEASAPWSFPYLYFTRIKYPVAIKQSIIN